MTRIPESHAAGDDSPTASAPGKVQDGLGKLPTTGAGMHDIGTPQQYVWPETFTAHDRPYAP